MSHDFVGLFGGGIGGDGVVDNHVFSKRDFFAVAIDGGRGGEGEVFDVVGLGFLEKILGAEAVHFLVKEGIFNRGADAGHGGKVDDDVDVVFVKNLFQGGAVANVGFVKLKIRVFKQRFDIFAFQGGVVKVTEIINHDDFLAVF